MKKILYQIDCSVASSGKKVSITKRRIRWRFGYANRTAIEYGASGVDCRGAEHEITLVWSITSGKKLVIQDGKEVYFAQGRRGDPKINYSWQVNSHVYTVIAHATTPLGKMRPDWKQYEMLIDGRPFSDFSRIYELGTGSMRASSERVPSLPPKLPSNKPSRAASAPAPVEYRCDTNVGRSVPDEYSWARSIHTIETRRQMNQSASTETTASGSYSSSVSRDVSLPQDLLSEPNPQTRQASAVTEFTPVPAQSHDYDYFNPQKPPSHEAIWSSIMDAYDSNLPVHQHTSATVGEVYAQPPVSSTNLYVDTAVVKHEGNAALESPSDVTELDGAMRNLVNLDDISQPVLQEYSQSDENTKPIDHNLSLSEMRKTTKTSTKEIMKTHNVQVYHHPQPGALVVYGHSQSHYNQYSQPPLPFGYSIPR